MRRVALELLDGIAIVLHAPTHRCLTILGRQVAKLTSRYAERIASWLFDITLDKVGLMEDEMPRASFHRNARKRNANRWRL